MFHKYMFITLLTFASLISTNVGAQENTGFWNFASCSATIDGLPFTLDLYEEVLSDSGELTGKGYVVQTMGPLTGENFKMMGKITVSENIDQTAIAVNMYSLTDSSVFFSRFEIDLTKDSEIEIYASGFGAVWGRFFCSPSPLQ